VLVGDEVVDLPTRQIWGDMREDLVRHYRDHDGVHWAGGLYLLLDVQEEPNSSTYYDLALFASVREMDGDKHALLKELNQTGDVNLQPTAADVTCCWEAGGQIEGGLKQYVGGLLKMVHYSRNANFSVEHVDWQYDGEWYEQRPNGFGRMVRDSAAHQDNFIGQISDFGQANGVFAYWNDHALVEVGESYGDYTQPAEVSFLDDILNGGDDGSDPNAGFVELTEEEIMELNMQSAYD